VTTSGAVHAYSNTNYILLSEIIARAAGESYGDFYQSQIATPLGLTQSFVTPRPREEFAQGVRGAGDEAINFFDLTTGVPSALYGEIFGDGPLAGTAAEGALFLDGLLGGEVLGAEALGEMLDFDPMTGYGLGITSFVAGDATWIGHSGSWGGFTALALYNTELDLTFMTVANHEADAEGQPFAALVLMEGITAAAAPIPEPAAAGAWAATAVLGLALTRRRTRAA
jgi:D-alanyl-D-alanine carboxypeptidase